MISVLQQHASILFQPELFLIAMFYLKQNWGLPRELAHTGSAYPVSLTSGKLHLRAAGITPST
jgi:hypothetical protein